MIYVLIMIAAGCWAVCQILDRYFFESVFKNLPARFWYFHESWKYAKQIFGYRIDAWHLFQSASVICMIVAIITNDSLLPWYVQLITYGLAWNLSFNFFYKILR